eukprot:12694028-Alexandrium_andersonii.AAC.1
MLKDSSKWKSAARSRNFGFSEFAVQERSAKRLRRARRPAPSAKSTSGARNGAECTPSRALRSDVDPDCPCR